MEKLSICIPFYKHKAELLKLLSAIPHDIPVKISDDSSTLKREELPEGLIVDIKPASKGRSIFENWNRASDMVQSEWFIIPGDDDIIYWEKLPLVTEAIKKYSDAGLIIFGHDYIDETDKVIDSWMPDEEIYANSREAFKYFQYGVSARWPAIVFNTAKFREMGKFDIEFQNTAADSYLIQKLALNYPVALISKKIGAYRLWSNQLTSSLIVTKSWFEQLELWMNKLQKDLDHVGNDCLYDLNQIKTRIYFENQVASLSQMRELKKGGRWQRFIFLSELPKLPRYNFKHIRTFASLILK